MAICQGNAPRVTGRVEIENNPRSCAASMVAYVSEAAEEE